jgi:hypothetical protein
MKNYKLLRNADNIFILMFSTVSVIFLIPLQYGDCIHKAYDTDISTEIGRHG